MPKAKKSKKPRKPMKPETVAMLKKVGLRLARFTFCLGATIAVVYVMSGYVERVTTASNLPPRMTLKDRPTWMTDFLAESILRQARPVQAHSPTDQEVLVAVADDVRHNPWVKKVRQVRRAFGERPGDTIEIDAEYRTPAALVKIGSEYRLVDTEGVVLPETFAAAQLPRIMLTADGHVNVRVIEGVVTRSPPAGAKWAAPDLAAGIDLVRLLYGKAFLDDVVIVDVKNYAGRVDSREAQLVLKTRQNSEVRWGRPINAKDYFVEVSPAQKLACLEAIVAQYKRIDAGQAWVDVRFDRVTQPAVGGAGGVAGTGGATP